MTTATLTDKQFDIINAMVEAERNFAGSQALARFMGRPARSVAATIARMNGLIDGGGDDAPSLRVTVAGMDAWRACAPRSVSVENISRLLSENASRREMGRAAADELPALVLAARALGMNMTDIATAAGVSRNQVNLAWRRARSAQG